MHNDLCSTACWWGQELTAHHLIMQRYLYGCKFWKWLGKQKSVSQNDFPFHKIHRGTLVNSLLFIVFLCLDFGYFQYGLFSKLAYDASNKPPWLLYCSGFSSWVSAGQIQQKLPQFPVGVSKVGPRNWQQWKLGYPNAGLGPKPQLSRIDSGKTHWLPFANTPKSRLNGAFSKFPTTT